MPSLLVALIVLVACSTALADATVPRDDCAPGKSEAGRLATPSAELAAAQSSALEPPVPDLTPEGIRVETRVARPPDRTAEPLASRAPPVPISG